MNDIANTIEEDILAMIPPVEVANARLDEFQKKLEAGLLTEGVDYEITDWGLSILSE